MDEWIATLRPELQAQLDEPIVVEWGFGAGPAFAGVQVNRCEPPRALREAIALLFERRQQMKRGHLRLADGTRLFFEPRGLIRVEP